MKNLLDFIVKYAYFILFILLEVFCFVLIFSKNPYQRQGFASSANIVSGRITESWNDVVAYLSLKEKNDSLLKENADLRNRMEGYRRHSIPTIGKKGFEYIAGTVVAATTNRVDNTITINSGKNSGIACDMGVIGKDGVVGIVCAVSSKYSTIMPIINLDTKISVKLSESGYFGSLGWDGKDLKYAQLTEIPGYVDVKKGDEIVTSGFSSIFPEGLMVGYVDSFEKDASTDFYAINVELATDFRNIKYVYVIKNNNKEELKKATETEKK